MMTSNIFDTIVSCRILKQNLDSALLQAAFHVGKPEYVRREIGKIPWRTKERPPCLGVMVKGNHLDR